jgi:hypothetical protein
MYVQKNLIYPIYINQNDQNIYYVSPSNDIVLVWFFSSASSQRSLSEP